MKVEARKGMNNPGKLRQALVVFALSALLLAGCSTTRHKAPVEDRSAQAAQTTAAAAVEASGAASAAAPAAAAASAPLPGAENAGKPGYYTVKAGDTLKRIAEENGQNWRDMARWNALENPNVLEVGQVLRVVPPAVQVGAAVRPVTPNGSVESRPPDAKAPPAAVLPPAAPATPASAAAPRDGGDEVAWAWPAAGPVAAGFNENTNKGLTILGAAGDPVLAAADGRVVYAGSSLRGYGNLVIIKHNEMYLSAYAHNKVLLVKDDQIVRRGQRIAEMGSTDADRVALHFEIRRQGKPIDPAKLLPPR